MKKLSRAPLVLLMGLALSIGVASTGCTKATTATVPGALNNADAQLYQDMHTAQAAIEQAKASIAQFPQFKDVLNKIIASYNSAEAAYQAYHVAKSGDLTMLQAQVAILMTDIGKLQGAMKGAKP
jgi:hypothetical protein